MLQAVGGARSVVTSWGQFHMLWFRLGAPVAAPDPCPTLSYELMGTLPCALPHRIMLSPLEGTREDRLEGQAASKSPQGAVSSQLLKSRQASGP